MKRVLGASVVLICLTVLPVCGFEPLGWDAAQYEAGIEKFISSGRSSVDPLGWLNGPVSTSSPEMNSLFQEFVKKGSPEFIPQCLDVQKSKQEVLFSEFLSPEEYVLVFTSPTDNSQDLSNSVLIRSQEGSRSEWTIPVNNFRVQWDDVLNEQRDLSFKTFFKLNSFLRPVTFEGLATLLQITKDESIDESELGFLEILRKNELLYEYNKRLFMPPAIKSFITTFYPGPLRKVMADKKQISESFDKTFYQELFIRVPSLNPSAGLTACLYLGAMSLADTTSSVVINERD